MAPSRGVHVHPCVDDNKIPCQSAWPGLKNALYLPGSRTPFPWPLAIYLQTFARKKTYYSWCFKGARRAADYQRAQYQIGDGNAEEVQSNAAQGNKKRLGFLVDM